MLALEVAYMWVDARSGSPSSLTFERLVRNAVPLTV